MSALDHPAPAPRKPCPSVERSSTPMHQNASGCNIPAKCEFSLTHFNTRLTQLADKSPKMSQIVPILSTTFQFKTNPNWPPHPSNVDDPLLLPKYISRYQRPERFAILPGSQSREMEIPPMQTVVHVTHEAIHKIGGIGAVLHGLFT